LGLGWPERAQSYSMTMQKRHGLHQSMTFL
jgi:hypothetical protein